MVLFGVLGILSRYVAPVGEWMVLPLTSTCSSSSVGRILLGMVLFFFVAV